MVEIDDLTKFMNAIVGNALVLVDSEWVITKANEAAGQLFDYESNQLIGMNLDALISPTDPARLNGLSQLMKPGTNQVEATVSMEKRTASVFTASITISRLSEPDWGSSHAVTIRDISEYQAVYAKQQALAAHATEFEHANQSTEELYERLSRVIEVSEQLRTIAEENERAADTARLEALGLRAESEKHAEEITQITQQKTAFFQNISHALRTPLTLILNPLEALGKEHHDDSRVELALRNSRRLLRLVNQLLDFQNLSAGRQELQLEPVNIVKFSRVCGDYFGTACESRGIEFIQELNGQPLCDKADEQAFILGNIDALEKIVFNLLSNALNYTSTEGQISFNLDEHNGCIRISITDSGEGLSSEALEKLVRLLSEVNESTKSAFESTGLGLALAKGLTQKMQGTMGVDSELGQGSTFWVEFAACDAPAERVDVDFKVTDSVLESAPRDTSKEPDTLAVMGHEGDGHTVLVVDDLDDMRDLIASTLSHLGYAVMKATDGKDALELVGLMRPDLIITDWMMPEMSGPDLIAALRADKSVAGIPIILLTAMSDEKSRVSNKQLGADALLGKPFDTEELTSTVRNLIKLRAHESEAIALSSYLANVLAALSEGVIILDPQYRITSVNPTFLGLVEKTEADLLGCDLGGTLSDYDLVKVMGVGNLFKDGEFSNVNLCFDCSSPSDITLTSSGSKVLDHEGGLVGYVVVARDEREMLRLMTLESRAVAGEREKATTLETLHAELKEASRRELRHTKNLLTQSEKLSQLGSMVASIGHEISNPIMLVSMSSESGLSYIGKLEKLLMPLFTGSEDAELIGVRVQELINQLRQINKTTTTGADRLRELSMALRTQSRMEQEATPDVAINQVIKESMVLVGGRTKLHGVQQSLQDLPPVTCFRSQIGQVVTNLLANAADALTEKVKQAKTNGGLRFEGQISITSECQERLGEPGVLVAVSDNGDGVPEKLRDKVFEQFFTTKAAGVGTGLGLSMCIDIVKDHGGHLSVNDDPNLGGARFEMWLPVHPT